MKLIETEKQEHCVSGGFVFKYRFDGEWNKERISAMSHLGQLQYYGLFPRPLYQIRCSDGTLVKGVESVTEFRVVFPRKNPKEAEADFKKRLQGLIEVMK
jgi:hypothetical protein